MNARSVERFHSRGQQLCKFIGTKRKFLHKKKKQYQKDWFGTPTWAPLYYLLVQSYGCRDVMWKRSIRACFHIKCVEWILGYSWEVKRWPLAEVLLYLRELSIDIVICHCLSPPFLLLRSTATASYHNEEQKWKHLVRKWKTKHCTPSILVTGGRDKWKVTRMYASID